MRDLHDEQRPSRRGGLSAFVASLLHAVLALISGNRRRANVEAGPHAPLTGPLFVEVSPAEPAVLEYRRGADQSERPSQVQGFPTVDSMTLVATEATAVRVPENTSAPVSEQASRERISLDEIDLHAGSRAELHSLRQDVSAAEIETLADDAAPQHDDPVRQGFSQIEGDERGWADAISLFVREASAAQNAEGCEALANNEAASTGDRAARDESERRDATETAEKAELAQQLTEAEAQRALEERRAAEVAEAERAAQEQREAAEREQKAERHRRLADAEAAERAKAARAAYEEQEKWEATQKAERLRSESEAAESTTGSASAGHIAANPPLPSSQYRPQLQERPEDAAAGAPPARRSATPSSPRMPEADLLLAFQPGGWGIAISVLLRRLEGTPDQVTVRLADETLDLTIIDEGLFEPVPLDDADTALRWGIAAEFEGDFPRRWVRTGRRLHVFSERTGVFGFATVPRVVIGQENVIVCESELTDRVCQLCQATGSGPLEEITGPGVPSGWRCFRGYRPRHPGARDDDEFLLALSPLPNAEIELAGGIAFGRGRWMSGRPPAIRILGREAGPGEVTIDMQPAIQAEEGGWEAPGWDSPGHHVVRYLGLFRRYEIAQVEEGWEWWPAHAGRGLAITGALAMCGDRRPAVVLQESEAWLLGSRPGEAIRAAFLRGDVGASASPRFAPVWAIPCGARPVARLLASFEAPKRRLTRTPPEAIRLWCQIVLRAARPPGGGDNGALELWLRYRQAARSLKRRLR